MCIGSQCILSFHCHQILNLSNLIAFDSTHTDAQLEADPHSSK